MAGAARKMKLTKYTVTIKREVVQQIVLSIEARNAEEAEDIAAANAEAYTANQWVQSVICQSTKAKVVRGD